MSSTAVSLAVEGSTVSTFPPNPLSAIAGAAICSDSTDELPSIGKVIPRSAGDEGLAGAAVSAVHNTNKIYSKTQRVA